MAGSLKDVHDAGFGKDDSDTWVQAAYKKLKSLGSGGDEAEASEDETPGQKPRIKPSHIGQ